VEFPECNRCKVDIKAAWQMEEPKRIISARIAARRLGISRPVLAKLIRREQVLSDFESDVGSFFDPASRRFSVSSIGGSSFRFLNAE